MIKPKNLDKYIAIRVNTRTQKAFLRKASEFGKPSEVLRELVIAFTEDRVTVKPPSTHRSIYHVN